MSFKDHTKFDSRLEAAAGARAAMLNRFRERPAADDPAVLARQAERQAIAAARQTRLEERELARLAEAERLAAIAAEEREAEVARKAAAAEAAAELTRREQERLKAERDARYAARKAKIRLRR